MTNRVSHQYRRGAKTEQRVQAHLTYVSRSSSLPESTRFHRWSSFSPDSMETAASFRATPWLSIPVAAGRQRLERRGSFASTLRFIHSIRRMRARAAERDTFCTYTRSYVHRTLCRFSLLDLPLDLALSSNRIGDVEQVQRHIYIPLGRGIPSHCHFCILLASRLLVSAPEDARDGQSGEPTIDRTLTEQQSQRQDRDSLLGCHIRRLGSEKVGRVQMGRMEAEVAPD